MGSKISNVSGGGGTGGGAPFSEPGSGPALESSLANHLLVAMPSLTDPNFSQTVALICEHTHKGALGIVLNKPLPMTLSDVLSQMKLEPSSDDIARGGHLDGVRDFVGMVPLAARTMKDEAAVRVHRSAT